MDIDLTELNNNNIDITGTYNLPKELITNPDIKDLEEVQVSGEIFIDEEDNEHITCNIKGNMILLDSVSLEEVTYPYEISYDDIIEDDWKKSDVLLDFFAFLWENIVLEIPLQFTKVKDLSKFHGDGWRLISEDERSYQNNPFSDLLKDYDKE